MRYGFLNRYSSSFTLSVSQGTARVGTWLLLAALAFASAIPGSVENEESPAGSVRCELLVRVTGESVPRGFVVPLVKEEIDRAVSLRPGAEYEIESKLESIIDKDLPRGTTKLFAVPIRMFGDGYAEVRRDVEVRVSNLVVEDMVRDGMFFASNSPEEIHRDGSLLSGRLDPFVPVRIFVHHKNASEKNLHFACVLYNSSSEAAQVHLIEGPVSVSKNEIRTGHFAAMTFFRNSVSRTGTFISIPPNDPHPLFRKEFPPGHSISYIGELTLMSAASVGFSIRTMYSYHADAAYLRRHSPTEIARPHGVFPTRVIETRDEYTIGDRWLYVPVGDRPIESINLQDRLHGNYGILHEIVVEVTNPSSRREKLKVHIRPSGGPASASIIVEDEFIEVPYAKSSEVKFLKAIPVNPREVRLVRVLTMPEPGSYYPIHMVFGSRPIKSDEQTANDK